MLFKCIIIRKSAIEIARSNRQILDQINLTQALYELIASFVTYNTEKSMSNQAESVIDHIIILGQRLINQCIVGEELIAYMCKRVHVQLIAAGSF
jgi:hypothetical protein